MSRRRHLVHRAQQGFSVRNRRRKLTHILAFMREHDVRTVLLVGVTRTAATHENIVERGIVAATDRLVASGLATTTVEPWPRYLACDGLSLPFHDQSFDLVVSNAVIEHVGGSDAQARFVAEHQRVGRDWIITTPNRVFPVESHTHVIGRHWSAGWRDQQQSFTRLLSLTEFRGLLPPHATVKGSRWGPTFTALSRPLGG